MKITIELPDDLHKALKSDFAAQVISESLLGLGLSASSKVAHLVLQAAQPGVQADNNRREQTWRCPKCGAEMFFSVDICGCGYCRRRKPLGGSTERNT